MARRVAGGCAMRTSGLFNISDLLEIINDP
jgi:hypothetical protein